MSAIPASKRTVLLRDYSGFAEFAAFGDDTTDTSTGGSWDWLTDLGKTVIQTAPQIISAVSGKSSPAPTPKATPTVTARAPSSGMPSWIVPAGIGVGALILIFAMKKK